MLPSERAEIYAKMGSGRKRVVGVCKAIIAYCEGPGGGEIDSLTEETLRLLAELSFLMKEAHWRAIEERERLIAIEMGRRAALKSPEVQEMIKRNREAAANGGVSGARVHALISRMSEEQRAALRALLTR